MTVYRNIFLDAAPVIYLLDKNEQYYATVFSWMESQRQADFVSSAITVMEYLVYPYRAENSVAVNTFFRFLADYDIAVFPIDRAVGEHAAKIRGKYKHFKAMDALQLSAALFSGCDAFLTNDRQLGQFQELSVVQVDELTAA